MLKNLSLNHGWICTSDGYNLVLKFEVQISNLERRVKVNSRIFCCFYQSQFFHRAFWESLILRHFKMNSMFLSLVLLVEKQASTDLSLILRNACFWFVDTCHNVYVLHLTILSQIEYQTCCRLGWVQSLFFLFSKSIWSFKLHTV